MSRRLVHLVLGLALAMVVGGRARAGTIPESERWVTVTHPGNEPYVYIDPNFQQASIGRVDYEYQISRTEVTGSEWFEFVQAYAPYVASTSRLSSSFTSQWIIPQDGPNGTSYALSSLGIERAVEVSWRFAARYCNWLHNGKGSEQAAFERGVYDTSTFGQFNVGPITVFTDQRERSEGARYWIPTLDERTKAVHFDPDRYGPGVPGYWEYPNASDSPPIPGLPGVGQTSAGLTIANVLYPPVGSYVGIESPWGLFDTSGSVSEWLESPAVTSQGLFVGRLYSGTSHLTDVPGSDFYDQIGYWSYSDPRSNPAGIRIARMVPGAGAGCVSLSIVLLGIRRQQRSKV